jgi:hypothetical protein
VLGALVWLVVVAGWMAPVGTRARRVWSAVRTCRGLSGPQGKLPLGPAVSSVAFRSADCR